MIRGEEPQRGNLLYVPGPAYSRPHTGTEVVVPVAVEVPDGVDVVLRVELPVGPADFVAVPDGMAVALRTAEALPV